MNKPLTSSASFGPENRSAASAAGFGRSAIARKGFTLVELLVVIGIIVVLISILIPVVGKIHQTAYQTSTKNEIAQIVGACQNYYQDFRAYPGPLSNSQIDNSFNAYSSPPVTPITGVYISHPGASGSGLSDTTPTLITGAPDTSATQILGNFTGSENLVLGLLGGLWLSPNTSRIEYVDGTPTGASYTNPQTLIGSGPRSLISTTSYGSNKQYTAYLGAAFPGSTLMLNGDGSPEDGVNPYHYGGVVSWNTIGSGKFYNTICPVFTDQFPDPMPILYLRARVGAHGIISGPATWTSLSPPSATATSDPTTGGTAQYNYDLREILPFTFITLVGTTAPGLGPTTGGIAALPGVSPNPNLGQHGLQGIYPTSSGSGSSAQPLYTLAQYQGQATPAPVSSPNLPVPTNTVYNAGQYFMNFSIPPTNTTSPNAPPDDYLNATGTPRAKDEFIIISAGKDRTYGTGDDITSFGDVEP